MRLWDLAEAASVARGSGLQGDTGAGTAGASCPHHSTQERGRELATYIPHHPPNLEGWIAHVDVIVTFWDYR